MATKDEISPSLLSLEKAEQPRRRKRRFLVFNSSPLARKIILFNLIALGILVSGVLYLNQSQDTQVAYRSEALGRQAEIMSAAIRSHYGEPDFANIEGPAFEALFQSMVANSNAVVRAYNADSQPVLTYVPRQRVSDTKGEDPDTISRILQKIWTSISSLPVSESSEDVQKGLEKQLDDLAAEAIAANGRTKNITMSIGGELFIAVALPIQAPDGANGAILVSTREGEVDSIIRTVREQILQMFLLATLSSIALSVILANSIARPLRRLSAAAREAQSDTGGAVNPIRVNIPDLSARPDEIGDLSRAMRNMTDALLYRIDENKTFAADVAHEIKNPLTSLRSAVESLGYVNDEASRQALLEVIRSDVDRLDRLVTDISNASRLEGELVRDTVEDIDISSLLQEMLQNYKAQSQNSGVEFKFESAVGDCQIQGLPGRLEQVFSNLVSNALSFVPDEDGWVKIALGYSQDRALLVEVSDNGPGIPEANLSDIFERFYSERPEVQFGEHSGLGLAISKQIVEAHGGRISARNTKMGGALFIVKLPL